MAIIFAGQFVEWMGASGVFYEKSTAYLKINFIGLFFDFAYFGYQALLNAQGRTRVITVVSTISSITNVLLDPIFIFATIPFTQIPGLNAGIEGAAWATVIAKFILWLLAIMATRRESIIHVPLVMKYIYDASVIRKILQVAWPSAFGYGGAAFGFTVLNGLIQSYGDFCSCMLILWSIVFQIF